jgi:DNA-binding IclR family transcriptional regulator
MARRSTTSLDSPSAKVIAVLDAVASRRVASVSAIATELAIPPPTIHRIAIELERLGYLQREPGSRHLMVSEPLVSLASNVLLAASGMAAVQAILRKISETLGEMCSLGVQMGDEVVYIASAEPQLDLMLSFRAGRKAPLYCTSSGRLFLARLADAELRAYLEGSRRKAFTPFTRTGAQQIMSDIRAVRAQGHAISNQEYLLHIVGAAVPVITPEGKLLAALSVSALNVRVSLEELRAFVPELQRAAAELAACLGRSGERLPASRLQRSLKRNARRPRQATRPARRARSS